MSAFTNTEELVHTEEHKGFTINLYLSEEYYNPDWDMTPRESNELLQRIRDGHVLWFCAKLTVSQQGIELASDHLGGCCYDSVEQFIGDAYYTDMKVNAITEAEQVIWRLNHD